LLLKGAGFWQNSSRFCHAGKQSYKCATEEQVKPLGELDEALGCLAQNHD
jgi:hypothetical protein